METVFMYVSEETLAQRIGASLNPEKFQAVYCDETQAELPECESASPLVILDATLRWTLCRPLLNTFAEHGCPILFLTGERHLSTHLKALYAGRSEVLPLSFGAKALNAKLASLGNGEKAEPSLSLDETERVALLDGRRVELTAQEYALLLALMECPDIPVSREHLLRTAWGYQSMGETRTVDVHVQRLRRKLGEKYIETVYKCGYRLRLA